MDNDAHDLAAAMMRRLEAQDRQIEAVSRQIERIERVQDDLVDMLHTMGDQCYAVAAAAERLTADR